MFLKIQRIISDKNFKSSTHILLMLTIALNLSCANLFSDMADKTTDKALLYEAKKKLGSGQWDGALEQISLMTTDFQGRRDVRVLKASAHAGKCGLNFVDLAQALQGGASGLFTILLQSRTGATQSNLDSCVLSEEILVSLGTPATRTTEENLLLAFSSLIKIADILNLRADTNASGTVDAGWDPCGGSGNTNLPTTDATTRADAAEIVTGLALFITSIAAAGAGDAAGDFYNDMNTLCSALGGQNPCNATTRASVDVGATHTKVIRALITGNDPGVGLAINACDTATCLATVCLTN